MKRRACLLLGVVIGLASTSVASAEAKASNGTMLHPERFTRGFSDAVRRLGLPAIRLHDLRHGWATLALQKGIHPKVVQERLGHANIGITLDTYSHVVAELHEEAAEDVAAMFLPVSNPLAEGT
jgi:integrase